MALGSLNDNIPVLERPERGSRTTRLSPSAGPRVSISEGDVTDESSRPPASGGGGGQQQQLSIGRVLIGNPIMILLDEPSEGIQPNIVQFIGQIIKRIRDEQKLAVIIVEQNLELIQATADRCLVVEKGKIITEILPDELSDPLVAKKYLAV